MILTPIITCKLVIFQYKTNYIDNYIKYFSLIDKNIVILKPNFTLYEFKIASYDADGYIYPGGSSDVYNLKSKYWDYVNLSFNQNKPIFGICNGFHHIIKKLNLYHPYEICKVKTNIIIKNRIHNHKWCTKFKPKGFNKTSFTFNNKTYINTIQNDRIYATVYHPEKVIQCNFKVNDCKSLYRIAMKDLIKFSNVLKCNKK